MSLQQKVERTLLEDLEKTGLPLDQISLVDICDAKEGIYGAPGKSRRPVQLRFQKIKDLTARSYRKLLYKHNITPSPPTLAAEAQESLDHQDDKDSIDNDDDEDDEDEEDDEDDEEDEEDDNTTADLSRAFASISIKSSKMFSPEKTPNKKALFSPTTGVSSPGHFITDIAATSLTDSSSGDDVDLALDTLDFRHQGGTKSRPYITLADPSHTEQNFPFDITPLEGVEFNNYEHNGFHIRMSVAAPDMNAWKAFIPSAKEFPKLAALIGRAVMVKGPSRSFWMRDAAIYHKKGVDCPVTKTAHEKTDTAIKEDPSRQTSFFLIVFHKDIVLDNYIFSGNDTILKMNKNGMKLDHGHEANPFKKKLKEVIGTCVWWRIGIAGGTRIRDAEAPESEDADALFD
jgi:hypothetical protein